MLSQWGPSTYGDPCRECGYDWQQSTEDSLASIGNIRQAFRLLIRPSDAGRFGSGLTWSAKAYVFHVADNFRIWAERLEAPASGGPARIATYGDNALAEARGYEAMRLELAWVALDWSVCEWLDAVRRAEHAEVRLEHPVRGTLTVDDVVATNCHDAVHHVWDVKRLMTGPLT